MPSQQAHENAVKHEIGKVLAAYLNCRLGDNNSGVLSLLLCHCQMLLKAETCKALPALYEEPHCPPALLPLHLNFLMPSLLLLLSQLGKKSLLANASVNSLRKFSVSQRQCGDC